ncbi:MAG: hypothetical protein NC489_23400, partial [Ruminococcus flavefaciens]|nr:hypothetical protein [Ruminococcus flavefaciens]
YYKYTHSTALEELDRYECREGTYVKGNIDIYIGKYLENGKFMRSSNTLLSLTGTKAYEFYTVPIAQGSYIRLMISDKSMLEKLASYTGGKGEGLYFEGEIVASPIEFNTAFYNSIEGFNAKDVVEPYVIKAVNMKSKKDMTYIGVLLLVFSALMFYSDGGVKSVITKENDTDDVKPKNNDYANSYNKSNELLLEKKRQQLFEKRLSELKKKCFMGFILLVLGVYILVRFYFLEIKLIGILLIIYSAKCIWKYFINSGSELALWLVRKFGLESVSVKIEESRINTWESERLLEKEE